MTRWVSWFDDKSPEAECDPFTSLESWRECRNTPNVFAEMEAILLIGIPGSGKSTFYERRFASSHLRISRDIAGTPARELRLLERCIAGRIDFVVDNTNVTIAQRQPFIEAARAASYRLIGYFFTTDIKECLARNAARTGQARVPVPGVYRARKVLQPPTYEEGFDALYEVRSDSDPILLPRP